MVLCYVYTSYPLSNCDRTIFDPVDVLVDTNTLFHTARLFVHTYRDFHTYVIVILVCVSSLFSHAYTVTPEPACGYRHSYMYYSVVSVPLHCCVSFLMSCYSECVYAVEARYVHDVVVVVALGVVDVAAVVVAEVDVHGRDGDASGEGVTRFSVCYNLNVDPLYLHCYCYYDGNV